MELGSGGQFLSSWWPHYLATRIWSNYTLLGTSKSLPDQPRPQCILLKKCYLAATDVPLCQMPNYVTYCQQLPTDQAGGWAAATALSWWCYRWKAEHIRLVNALDSNNNLIIEFYHCYVFANNDHRLRGSASPVLTATGFVSGRGQFLIPTESTPLDQSPKNLLLVITSAPPMAVPNLVQICPRGASGQVGEI